MKYPSYIRLNAPHRATLRFKQTTRLIDNISMQEVVEINKSITQRWGDYYKMDGENEKRITPTQLERACLNYFKHFKALKFNKKFFDFAKWEYFKFLPVETFNEYLENGKGLFIHGGIGTGKTTLLHLIMLHLIRCVHEEMSSPLNILYISASEFSSQIYTSEKYELKALVENLRNADVLFLDDLGSEAGTQYSLSYLFSIIDSRYVEKRLTFISSNLGIKSTEQQPGLMEKPGYERMGDRFNDSSWMGRLFLSGKSKRK